MKPPKKTPVSGCVLAGPYLCAAQVARGKGARGQHFGTLAKLWTASFLYQTLARSSLMHGC